MHEIKRTESGVKPISTTNLSNLSAYELRELIHDNTKKITQLRDDLEQYSTNKPNILSSDILIQIERLSNEITAAIRLNLSNIFKR